jgi:hypothetical protein
MNGARARERRRYKWCPVCEELWVAARMARTGVNRCPLCDGVVLAYVGRSPYDIVSEPGTDVPRSAEGRGSQWQEPALLFLPEVVVRCEDVVDRRRGGQLRAGH